MAGGAAFVANWVFWSESGYFDQASTLKPLLHLWSLAIEEQFYLFFPLLMAGLLAMGRGSRRVLVIALGAIAFFQDTIQADMLADPDFKGVVFPTLTMIGIMLIGLAIVATLFVFFGRLRAIINTVGEGDPFVPVNAERLSLMAWLMLGVQLLVLAAIPFAFGSLRSGGLGKRLFIGIVFALGFWLLQTQFVRLAQVYRFDFRVAYLLPTVIMVAVSVVLFRRRSG